MIIAIMQTFESIGKNLYDYDQKQTDVIDEINYQIPYGRIGKLFQAYVYHTKVPFVFFSVCIVLFFVYLVTLAIVVYAFISNMFVSLLYISFVRFNIAISGCFSYQLSSVVKCLAIVVRTS